MKCKIWVMSLSFNVKYGLIFIFAPRLDNPDILKVIYLN